MTLHAHGADRTAQQSGETITPTAQQIAAALDDLHLAVNFHKPYFNTKEAAAYSNVDPRPLCLLVRRGDGTISRKALDKIKSREWTAKRGPKGRPSPHSRASR